MNQSLTHLISVITLLLFGLAVFHGHHLTGTLQYLRMKFCLGQTRPVIPYLAVLKFVMTYTVTMGGSELRRYGCIAERTVTSDKV